MFFLSDKFPHKTRESLLQSEPKRASSGGPMLFKTQKLLTKFFKPFNNELRTLLKDLDYDIDISY